MSTISKSCHNSSFHHTKVCTLWLGSPRQGIPMISRHINILQAVRELYALNGIELSSLHQFLHCWLMYLLSAPISSTVIAWRPCTSPEVKPPSSNTSIHEAKQALSNTLILFWRLFCNLLWLYQTTKALSSDCRSDLACHRSRHRPRTWRPGPFGVTGWGRLQCRVA